MSLFSVVCETCGAKLKVRDAAIVGQIHACPKCESMVLIAVPAAISSPKPVVPPVAPSASPATDGTIAPDDFATEIDELLQPPPPAEPADTQAEPEVPDVASMVESVESQPEPVSQTPAEPPGEAAELTTATNGASQTSFWVWTIAGCTGFFALGLLGAAWWTRSGEEPQAAQVAAVTEDPSPEASPPTEPESAAEQISVNKPAIEVASRPEEPAAPAALPDAETAEPDPVPVEPLPELPPVGENEPVEPAPEQPAANRVNLAPLDPLAIDSANLDLLLIPDVDPTVTADAPVEFGPEEASDTEELEIDLPQKKNIRFEPGTASRGPSYAEPLAAGELASRLEMKLPGIAWKRTPLVVSLRELEQLSGVPITVRGADLRMAGVTATHEVSVAKENATVRQLASELAKEAHLRAETTPQGLVLVRSGTEKWHDVGSPQYDVSDLVSSAEQAGALGDLLQQVVAPDSWQQAEAKLAIDGTTLKIHQQLGVHYDILKFIERLRMARGLPTRSKYPKSMLTIEPRLASMKKQLDRPTTFAFVDWTPLADVFDYWQETSGLAMLPDWQHLADSDLRPLATLAGSVDNVAFSDALNTCLGPLDMAWTPVDGSTLELTTQAAVNHACWVEFYAGVEANELRERIESTVEPQMLQQFVLEADASGKFVLVYGNRYVHQAAVK